MVELVCSFVFKDLSRPRSQRKQSEKGDRKGPHLGYFHQCLRGDTKMFPCHQRDRISPGPMVFSWMGMPETPPQENEQGTSWPYAQTTSTLTLGVLAPHPTSKKEPWHTAKETHFGHFTSWSRPFNHYPKSTIVWTGKLKVSPSCLEELWANLINSWGAALV